MLEVNHVRKRQASVLEVEVERKPRVWPLLGPTETTEMREEGRSQDSQVCGSLTNHIAMPAWSGQRVLISS
jgi:hypothetical protein